MGFADKAKDLLGDAAAQAEKLAAEHGDKADDAIDKATALIASKTSPSVGDKVAKAADKAKEMVDDLAEKGQDPTQP